LWVLLFISRWQGPPQLDGLLIATANHIHRKLYIFEPDNRIGRNVFQQCDVTFGKELRLHIGHDGYGMNVAYRQLAFNIEGTDTFDVVTKEFDAVGQVV